MLVEIYQIRTEYSRLSKTGKLHTYFRNRSIAVLKCDCCKNNFERPVGQIDYRRLSLDHSHVCPTCNQKKFAQKRSIVSKRFWNTTVDLDIDIDTI